MAWLLGLFDKFLPGPGLYLIFTMSLLAAAWSIVLKLGRPGIPAMAFLVLIFATPQLLLHQATIWKDVLFADAGILGFAAIAMAAARWNNNRARIAWLALAAAALALAILARQNGFLILPIAAIVLGIAGSRQSSPRQGWRHGAGFLLISLALAGSANFALSFRTDGGQGAAEQLRLAQTYDLVGAIRMDPALRLSVLETRAPALNKAIREEGVALYSPRLVDTLEASSALTAAIGRAPRGAIFAAWRELVFNRTGLYVRERWPVFRWVVAPPYIMVCHPDVVGVDGPPGYSPIIGSAARPQGS